MAPPPSPRPTFPGYELHRVIGRGAYGEVWLACDAMGVWRAVKVIYRERFGSAVPFERELAGLRRFMPVSRSHESQVDVLEFREEESRFSYVMELADDRRAGQTIDPEDYVPRTLASELAEKGRLPAAECLAVGIALSTALKHLHEQNLVHRDIKPSNVVFIHGQPKLADIGLVAIPDEARSFVGTEGFVPREGSGTRQADLYSLGRVLYQMHTGHEQSRFPELPTHLAAGDDAALARELNLIILKACAPASDSRQDGAAGLCDELLALQGGRSIRRLRDSERRAVVLARVGAILLGLVGLGGVAVAAAWRSAHAAVEAHARTLQAEGILRKELIRTNTEHGLERLEAGDSFAALPWLVEALAIEDDPRARARQRTRIAGILESTPRLERAFFHPGLLNRIAFSPDGTRLLTACQDGAARIWSVADGGLLATLQHEGEVTGIAWDAAGEKVATASADRTARVWRAATGTPLTPPLPHGDEVEGVALSADGLLLATASADHCARLWTLDAEMPRFVFEQAGQAKCVAFSPDGRMLATSSVARDSTRLWDTATGLPATDRIAHGPWTNDLVFSRDGQRLAIASWGQRLVVSTRDGRRILSGAEQSEAVGRIAWSPDQSALASASNDGSVLVSSVRDGSVVARISHRQPARSVAFSPDGTKVASAGEDGTVRVCRPWLADSSRASYPPLYHSGRALDAVFHPDGKRLATAGFDRMVRLWALDRPETAVVMKHRDQMIRRGRFSADGALFVVAESGGAVHVWDSRTGLAHRPPIEVGTPVHDAAFDPAAARIATIAGFVNDDGTGPGAHAAVWRLGTGERLAVTPRLGNEALGVAFSADGREFVTLACADASSHYLNQRIHISKSPVTFRRWDAATGAPLGGDVSTGDGAWFAALSASGDRVAVAFRQPESAFQIWETKTGRAVTGRVGVESAVWHLEFSPDGTRMAVTTAQGIATGGGAFARVFDAATGAAVSAPMWHEADIYHAAFSADGRRLVTASQDATARVWDATTGTPVTPPLHHHWKVAHATFSGDGTRVATASSDRDARVWDVESGELLIPPLQHANRVFYAWMSRDGASVMTALENGECRHWRIPTTDEPLALLRARVELLRAERKGDVPLTPGELRERWESVTAPLVLPPANEFR